MFRTVTSPIFIDEPAGRITVSATRVAMPSLAETVACLSPAVNELLPTLMLLPAGTAMDPDTSTAVLFSEEITAGVETAV